MLKQIRWLVAGYALLTAGCAAPHKPCPRCPEPHARAARGDGQRARTAAGPGAQDRPLDPAMVRVPAGPFLRGTPAGVGLEDERPRRTIYLSAFDIDRLEVTVEQYAKCVAAGRCAPPRCSTASQRPETRPKHPVVCMPWKEARNYCLWAAKRLPTEAEWEKAARGSGGATYPWGNLSPGESQVKRANYTGADDGFASTAPVGSFPDGVSPYGVYDMEGNVSEWTATIYRNYPYNAADGREDSTDTTSDRVVRGTSWVSDAGGQPSYTRGVRGLTNLEGLNSYGFRCVRTP